MRRKLDEKCREHKEKEEQEQLKVTEVHSESVPSDHEMADIFSEILMDLEQSHLSCL